MPQDPDLRIILSDVLFLERHPGMTYDDLRNLPQRFVDVEQGLLRARAFVAQSRA